MCGETRKGMEDSYWEVDMLGMTHQSMEGEIVSKLATANYQDNKPMSAAGLYSLYGNMARIMKNPRLYEKYLKYSVLELVYICEIMNDLGLDCKGWTEQAILLIQNYNKDMSHKEKIEYTTNISSIVREMIKGYENIEALCEERCNKGENIRLSVKYQDKYKELFRYEKLIDESMKGILLVEFGYYFLCSYNDMYHKCTCFSGIDELCGDVCFRNMVITQFVFTDMLNSLFLKAKELIEKN